MLTFFGESFGVFAKSITFASAFENELIELTTR